jgi:hypothetical protein
MHPAFFFATVKLSFPEGPLIGKFVPQGFAE